MGVWHQMNKEQRAGAIRAHYSRTYAEIGRLLGATGQVVGKFARENNLDKAKHDLQRRTKKRNELLDQAAEYWHGEKSSAQIAQELGISPTSMDKLISRARLAGDERFPARFSSKVGNRRHGVNITAPKKIKNALPLEVYYALKCEVHPDGRPYTKQCIFDAMRGRGIKLRPPVGALNAISQRELTNRMQLARVAS